MLLLQAKAKERNGSNRKPKLCYHAKLHGKLPFDLGKLRLEPSKVARLKLVHCQAGGSYGEAPLSSPENAISGPESTQNSELGPTSGPNSQNSANLWSETGISGQEVQNQSNPGGSSPVLGPEFPQNSTKVKDWAPKIQFRAQNQKKRLNSGTKIGFRVPNRTKIQPKIQLRPKN